MGIHNFAFPINLKYTAGRYSETIEKIYERAKVMHDQQLEYCLKTVLTITPVSSLLGGYNSSYYLTTIGLQPNVDV
jgi:hypothetical protein